jgi:hypothetical protein
MSNIQKRAIVIRYEGAELHENVLAKLVQVIAEYPFTKKSEIIVSTYNKDELHLLPKVKPISQLVKIFKEEILHGYVADNPLLISNNLKTLLFFKACILNKITADELCEINKMLPSNIRQSDLSQLRKRLIVFLLNML